MTSNGASVIQRRSFCLWLMRPTGRQETTHTLKLSDFFGDSIRVSESWHSRLRLVLLSKPYRTSLMVLTLHVQKFEQKTLLILESLCIDATSRSKFSKTRTR